MLAPTLGALAVLVSLIAVGLLHSLEAHVSFVLATGVGFCILLVGHILLARLPAPREHLLDNNLSQVSDGIAPDDCFRFADEAASERRWLRALHWARRAKAQLPPSSPLWARATADEGEYLYQVGLYEEAFVVLAAAADAAPDGYTAFRAAQAAEAAGQPIDTVLRLIQQALAKSPDLIGDLECFPEHDQIRRMPQFKDMARNAYARLNLDPPTGGPA